MRGTAAKSGGDVYALYRILRAGYSDCIYAPRALRGTGTEQATSELENMLYGYSVGGYCMLFSALFRERDPEALLVGLFLVSPLSSSRTLASHCAGVPDPARLSLIVREITRCVRCASRVLEMPPQGASTRSACGRILRTRMISVSVIIPTHNRAALLPRTLGISCSSGSTCQRL